MNNVQETQAVSSTLACPARVHILKSTVQTGGQPTSTSNTQFML